MREFMLNSENLFDAKAYEALVNGSVPGILSCRKVAWNDRIQLVYFTTGLENLNARLDSFTLDDIRETGCEIVDIVKKAEDNPYVFKSATLFGAGEGTQDELLYGRQSLMRDIREATGGRRDVVNNNTFYIYGASDPDETADAVLRKLKVGLRTA